MIPLVHIGHICSCGWQVKLCDPLVTHGPYLCTLEIIIKRYAFILLTYYCRRVYDCVFSIQLLKFNKCCVLVLCSVTNARTWLRFTRESLCRAQSERHRSAVVRAECEQLIRREALELWTRIQLVSRMIAIRVANTNDATQKLRQHVERVRCGQGHNPPHDCVYHHHCGTSYADISNSV